ncbi:ABC transporter substrate-binding protein [Zooshikella sp. RANM57]|uniref:ABC transporter substrate-binding protein n=1 Tax=Zooshikella sp. RANM57 TaxID=3425863 RepID=UPI003D6FB700
MRDVMQGVCFQQSFKSMGGSHQGSPLLTALRAMLTLGWLFIGLVLAGCQQEESASSTVSQSTSQQKADNEQIWHTFTDVTGYEVTLAKAPQRLVVLSEMDLDMLLALGISPVGTTAGRGQPGIPRYLADNEQLHDIRMVGRLGQPSLDMLVELQPDLILVGGLNNPQLLKQLRKVAPTAVSYHATEDWQTALQRVAGWLRKESSAEQFIQHYQQQVQSIRQQLGDQQQATVSVVRWNPQGPGYMLQGAFVSQVLADLQLKRPEAQRQPGPGHSPPLSLEALSLIDGDWLFVGTLTVSGKAVDAMQAMQRMPVYQSLRAVQNKHVVNVDGSLWTSVGGPLAAMAVLKDVADSMTAGS